MGRSPAVIPQPEFDSPLVRAKLDTMLLLADALQPSLTRLQQLFPGDWDKIVSGLNNTFLAQIDSVTQASDAQSAGRKLITGYGLEAHENQKAEEI